MRLLVFGSRAWTDEFIVVAVLQGFLAKCQSAGEELIVIDGKAPGADSLAGIFYGIHGIHVDVEHERYAADWDRYGDAAGPIRNGVMLSEGKPDIAVGFVDGVDAKGRPTSRGSGDMWDRLQAVGVPTYLVLRGKGKP